MSNLTLSNQNWQSIYAFLQTCSNIYVGDELATRQFIEAIHWIARSGAQWRLLPEGYGQWNSIYKRFVRWGEQGIWQKMFEHFAADPDMEWIAFDSTIVRAHPCAAGALKKDGGQEAQALGRSRGGFSTKIHIVVDALGNPLDLVLTGGQVHDVTQAPTLLGERESDFVLGDKSYDADELIELIEAKHAIPVIPPRRHRKDQRWYDPDLYKERHAVECFVNKIKHFRHIFSRFDKLAGRYLSFLHFVSALIWLR